MVVIFAKRHFCGGFLDGKMTKLNVNAEDFGWSSGCVRGLRQREECVEKRVGLETCRKTYSKG